MSQLDKGHTPVPLSVTQVALCKLLKALGLNYLSQADAENHA